MLRLKVLIGMFIFFGILISLRLFYWQVIASSELSAKAQGQYLRRFEIPARRGEIMTSDGFPIVTNQEAYLLYAKPNDLKEKPQDIAHKLAIVLEKNNSDALTEKDIELSEEKNANLEGKLTQLLSKNDVYWVLLTKKITKEEKNEIEKLGISGLDFQKGQMRYYPEGSMSAQLLGFVGSDEAGRDIGYFGVEGSYNRQLKGKPGLLKQESDPQGHPILTGDFLPVNPENGYSLVLTIDRSAQLIVEEELKKAIEKYQAKGGLVAIMDPSSGAIIAAAASPSYDAASWENFDDSTYKSPIIGSTYEPGSTFKVLVMSAALNEGLNPDTVCDKCQGPRDIGGYTIRTWNNKYYPESKPQDIIQHSDNIGMVFVEEKLGKDNFLKYLKKFGIGGETGVDLQEETTGNIRKDSEWKQIDFATASFGQGIAVTPIQMVRAVSAIANGGNLVKPYLVKEIIKNNGERIETKPEVEKSDVISQKTAKIITQMMVNAVDAGEAKAFKPKGYQFAGKTGTAQIPVEGHYDPKKTIASFIGFGPVDNPKFVMLVRIDEPQTSQFGSETAAPTFFAISRELYNLWGILPIK